MPCLAGPCIFCNVSRERGFDVLVENDRFVCFRDRDPKAATHLQVIPREHIDSVKLLRQYDVGLVEAMRDFGQQALAQLSVSPDQRRFGYHIPPVTSVQHLHLHCFGLPFTGYHGRLKYPVNERSNGTKGFSWFAEVSQVIRILRRGGQVQIWPESVGAQK